MRQRNAGFTVLEALVAFLALALAVGAIYRASFDLQRLERQTLADYRATEAGTSLLTELTTLHHPTQMPRGGTYAEHWAWTLNVERRYHPTVEIYRELGGLYDLELSIAGPSEAPVVLTTTVLRRAP